MADEPNPFAAWGHAVASAPLANVAPAAPAAVGDPPAVAVAHHAHVRVTAPRLILCAVLAAGLAAAIVIALGSSGPPALKTLRAASFTTLVPAGYAVTLTHPLAGFDNFRLLSRTAAGAPANVDGGVPPAGTIELTLSEVPSAVASAQTHNPRLQTLPPMALLGLLVHLPDGASHVVTSARLRRTSLGGQAAAAITYTYSYHGLVNVQSDVVTRRGTQLVGVELDSEPALSERAAAAEQTVLSNWAWNTPSVS
jgi:hypothetical protein